MGSPATRSSSLARTIPEETRTTPSSTCISTKPSTFPSLFDHSRLADPALSSLPSEPRNLATGRIFLTLRRKLSTEAPSCSQLPSSRREPTCGRASLAPCCSSWDPSLASPMSSTPTFPDSSPVRLVSGTSGSPDGPRFERTSPPRTSSSSTLAPSTNETTNTGTTSTTSGRTHRPPESTVLINKLLLYLLPLYQPNNKSRTSSIMPLVELIYSQMSLWLLNFSLLIFSCESVFCFYSCSKMFNSSTCL